MTGGGDKTFTAVVDFCDFAESLPAFELADAAPPPAAPLVPGGAAELRLDAVTATFETPELPAALEPGANEPAFELERVLRDSGAAEDATVAFFGAIR